MPGRDGFCFTPAPELYSALSSSLTGPMSPWTLLNTRGPFGSAGRGAHEEYGGKQENSEERAAPLVLAFLTGRYLTGPHRGRTILVIYTHDVFVSGPKFEPKSDPTSYKTRFQNRLNSGCHSECEFVLLLT